MPSTKILSPTQLPAGGSRGSTTLVSSVLIHIELSLAHKAICKSTRRWQLPLTSTLILLRIYCSIVYWSSFSSNIQDAAGTTDGAYINCGTAHWNEATRAAVLFGRAANYSSVLDATNRVFGTSGVENTVKIIILVDNSTLRGRERIVSVREKSSLATGLESLCQSLPSTHVLEEHNSIACDSMPLIFCGFMLQTPMIIRSFKLSRGTRPARPEMTVLGPLSSPKSIFSR